MLRSSSEATNADLNARKNEAMKGGRKKIATLTAPPFPFRESFDPSTSSLAKMLSLSSTLQKGNPILKKSKNGGVI